MNKYIYTSKFSKIFFINFFSTSSLNDPSSLSHDLESYFDIFIYGRSEGIFLNFLDKNKISINEEKLKVLKENTKQRWLKSSLTIHCSNKIFKKLNDNNIKFIPLKGAQLILFYNFDLSLRPIRDLDILVKENDIPRIVEILSDLGFFFKSNKKFYKSHKKYINKGNYDIEPMFNEDGVCIEIHYKIQNSQICEIADEFWNNVNEQNYGKNKLLLLSPEHIAVHLIYHSISKQGIDVGIQALFDFYNLIRLPNFDVKKLLILAKKYNLLAELTIFFRIFEKYTEYKIEKNFSEKLLKINDRIIEDCLRLFYFNNANNHSLKLFRYKFKDLIFNSFKKETIKSDYSYIENKFLYSQIFIKTISRNIKRYLPIFFKLILDKNFRHDNKLTSDILKSISK